MTIFRGIGGGGNATTDSEINVLTQLANQAEDFAEQAGLEADAAAASAAAASGSAFDANASAVAALASETEAALSESAAAISASNALASENTAATAAGTSTTQAGLSAASAAASDASAVASAASAAAALVSEGNAATSASTATTQAGIATTGAGTATTQAGNASTSAAAALVSEGASAASAAAALASEGAAATSASNAATSETNAAASEAAAAASAASINDANLVHKTGDETIAGVKTFTSNAVIATNTASDALRITQTGTGNAFVVEDSTSPDASPVVIDAGGRVLVGYTQNVIPAGLNPILQVQGQSANLGWSTNSAASPTQSFFRSASGITGTNGAVSSGFDLGELTFYGDDGTAFIEAASILAEVDGTPGTNDMPGRLTFSTTADGASSPTERMRITSAGNVGIGTSSPNAKLVVSGSGSVSAQVNSSDSGGSNLLLTATGAAGEVNMINGLPLLFKTANAERARIDSSGNLLVGRSTAYSDGNLGTPLFQVKGVVGAAAAAAFIANTTGGINIIGFVNPNGTVGTINVSGTATAYNTSSDYRLKDTIAPMIGALAKVALLKPATYKWKVDGSDGQGFIAHELQAVVPGCVTGEKDAVDSEGKPQYQGIDTSFLVATLTAALQELNAKFDAYVASHP